MRAKQKDGHVDPVGCSDLVEGRWFPQGALTCVLGTILAACSPVQGQDSPASPGIGSPLPPRVVDNWTARQTGTEALECVLEWRRLIPEGTYSDEGIAPADETGVLPPEDVWLENSYSLWLDFTDDRARVEYEGYIFHSTREFQRHVPIHMISLFDGEHLQLFEPAENNPRPDNPYLEELKERIPDGRYQGLFLEAVAYPVFFGQGILSGPLGGITPSSMRRPVDATAFRVAAPGDVRDGEPLVLESIPFGTKGDQYVEVSVDPQRDYVITRWAWYIGESLRREYRIEPAETERGWMPDAWTFTIYAPSGDVLERSECAVVKRVFDPDLSAVAFHVEPRAGTFYRDERTEQSWYVTGAGERLPRADAIRQTLARQKWRSRMFAFGIAAVLVFGGAWWIFRRSRRGVA